MWVPCLCLDQLGLVHPERFRFLRRMESRHCGCSFPLGGEAARIFFAGGVLGPGLGWPQLVARTGCSRFARGCSASICSLLAGGLAAPLGEAGYQW